MNAAFNTDQLLQVITLPIMFVVIGMLAKRLGKRDGDDAPRINDWAVSTSIILMTFSKIAGDLVEYENENKHSPVPVWCLYLILLFLFFSIEHDRFKSWKMDKQSGTLTKEKKLLCGIIIPNIISILLFAIYQLYKLHRI